MSPDFRAIFEGLPGRVVILDPGFNVVEASDAYLRVAGVTREELLGRFIFDVFPENPDTPEVRSVENLTASLQRVIQSRRPDVIPAQRYDTPSNPGGGDHGGPYRERHWRSVNSPILDASGNVQWILVEVEEVTEEALRGNGERDNGPFAEERRRTVGLMRAGSALLRDLPDRMFDLLAGHLTPVRLAADAVLIEPLQPVETVYFPLYGLISITRQLEDGSSVEVAIGGQDGLIGSSVLTGEPYEETEARALVDGTALSIPARTLQEVMTVHPELRAALSRILPVLIARMGLSAACLARHTLDQRLARWLLTAASRTGSLDLPLRQESLAHALGVRRTGVSEALTRLEDAGIVTPGRGRIVIRNPDRLAKKSCPCFREAEESRLRVAVYGTAAALTAPAEIAALARRYIDLAAQ